MYIANMIQMHRILSFWYESVDWNLKLGVPQWHIGYNHTGSGNTTQFIFYLDFFKNTNIVSYAAFGRDKIRISGAKPEPGAKC